MASIFQILALVLLWVIPGLIWALLILRWPLGEHGLTAGGRFLLGQAAGYATVLLSALCAAYLPGPFRPALFLLAILVILAASGLISYRANGPLIRADWLFFLAWPRFQIIDWLLLILLIGVPLWFRFLNLEYSQFQGDEGAAVTRAARIMIGGETDIFLHKKGPGELLIVAATWSLTGTVSEWLVRVPFAWANSLAIWTVFQIGTLVSKRRVIGFLAALLIALEGYLIGFGRIVQYQSVVVFMVTAGVLALFIHFRQRQTYGLLYLAAGLFACGVLAHYDAGLVFPALLVVIIGDGLSRWRSNELGFGWLLHMAGAALLASIILALFYYPFFTNPQAGATSDYLIGRIGAGDERFNHLADTLGRTVIYDSIYLLGLITFGIGVWLIIKWSAWSRWLAIVPILLLVGVSVTYFDPAWWVGPDWWPFALLMVFTAALPWLSTTERATWLWFSFPAFFYLYLVALPLTHIYSAIPGLFLIGGLGLGMLFFKQDQPAGRAEAQYGSGRSLSLQIGSGLLVMVPFLLSAYFAHQVFVSHEPEYLRNIESLPPLLAHPRFPVPEEGLFGFPYQAGWLAANYLFDESVLSGSYDTNEETDITNYYVHSGTRLTCASPDIYLIAKNVQDEVSVREDQIESEFEATRILTIDGEPKLTVFERGDRVETSGGPLVEPAEPYIRAAQRLMRPEYVARLSGVITNESELPYYVPLEAQLGDFAKLRGYQLDTANATPGGYVDLTMVWEVTGTPGVNYQSFTHMHDGTVMRGQLDGRPQCGNAPTAQWQPGQFLVDPYRIPIQPDAALGEVPLTTGLYDLATLERVPVMQDGEADNKVDISIVVIE